jgi:hypothetical protein
MAQTVARIKPISFGRLSSVSTLLRKMLDIHKCKQIENPRSLRGIFMFDHIKGDDSFSRSVGTV